MKERPILFSAPMVRAILDGSKTQMRRIYKTRNGGIYPNPRDIPGMRQILRECPYGQPSDRLWVRESWQAWRRTSYEYDEWEVCAGPPSQILDQYGRPSIEYQATSKSSGPWRPSIHMPRWASRILLEITDVRVERLNEISGEDAVSEGVHSRRPYNGIARFEFRRLWESINGRGSWHENPWVWVVDFRRIEP